MAAEGPFKELCEEATCSICLDFFRDPVAIAECGHSFCRACLTRTWGEAGAEPSCPQCRGRAQPKGLRPNHQLANFVEIIRKLSPREGKGAEAKGGVCKKHQEPLKFFCQEDEAPLCVVCRVSREHKDHEVIPLEEAARENRAVVAARKGRVCQKHKEPMKLFCKDNEALVCVVCDRSKEHRDHETLPVEEAFQEYKLSDESVRLALETPLVSSTNRRPQNPWVWDTELFPPYSENQDIWGYFSLFEISCHELGVPKALYMSILRSKITGPLADLISHLPTSEINDYENFKTLALQRFALSAETYRRAFRKVDRASAFTNFPLALTKLTQNFDYWLKAEGINNFESLKNLILLEQFYRLVPDDICCFVKDWDPKTPGQAAALAEKFRLHRAKSVTATGVAKSPGADGRKTFQAELEKASSKHCSPTAEVHPHVPTSLGRCFYCKKEGHIKAACPLLKEKERKKASSSPRVRVVHAPAETPQEDWDMEVQAFGQEQ